MPALPGDSGVRAPERMSGLIIVVNHNQEQEIDRFLTELRAENPGLDVVVIDDGSSDRSPELAERHGYPVLRHPHNRGVGAAIRTGIRHAQAAGRPFLFLTTGLKR